MNISGGIFQREHFGGIFEKEYFRGNVSGEYLRGIISAGNISEATFLCVNQSPTSSDCI